MTERLIIDETSVYEIDEECMRIKKEEEQKRLKAVKKEEALKGKGRLPGAS